MLIKLFIILYLLLTVSLNAIDLSDYINTQNCDQIIDKQVYTICYSYKYKGAKYIAYTLDGSKVNKLNIKKRPRFYSQKSIPIKYRSKSSDYKNSGYDRGHIASDASFDYDKKVLSKVYTMANIIPQTPNINRIVWKKAEKYARYLAIQLASINIINGIVYKENSKKIGKNKISVPTAFWKIYYNKKENFQRCFYFKNSKNITYKKLKYYVINCNDLNIKV